MWSWKKVANNNNVHSTQYLPKINDTLFTSANDHALKTKKTFIALISKWKSIDANDALHICNQFNNQKRVLITFERAPFFEGLRLSSVLSEGKFFLSQSKSFSFIFFYFKLYYYGITSLKMLFQWVASTINFYRNYTNAKIYLYLRNLTDN